MESREHLYRTHLEEKRELMISLLETIGCGDLCRKITPSPVQGGFRNRAKFQVYDNQGKVRVEGTDPYEGNVPFVRALWILPAWARPIVEHVADFRDVFKHDFPFDGFELQLAHGRQQAHVLFSVKRVSSESFEAQAIDLWKTVPELIGVAIPSQKLELGDVCLDHRIREKSFLAHYDSFFQSNLSLTPRLLDRLALETKKIEYEGITDLYCGVGLLSLSFAKKEARIVGIDSELKSVDCVRKNASRLGFEWASFQHSRVESFVKSSRLCPDNLVIINPPRAGCDSSVITSIVQQRPSNIILVSCYLETQLRDLKLWMEKGYKLVSISAFDMFPFTPFLETITRLQLDKGLSPSV